MATVTFLYRSKKPKGYLTLRFRHYKKLDDDKIDDFNADIKTKEYVSEQDWNTKNFTKEFKRKLEDIEDYILEGFNNKYPNLIFSKDWLQSKYEEFLNDGKALVKNTLLTDWIQHEIDDLKLNGMSQSRIKGFATYKGIIEEYNPNLYIPDLTHAEFESLKKWLLGDKKYGLGTAEKMLDDIRTVCRNTKASGVKLADDFDNFIVRNRKSKSRDKKKRVIMVLSLDEIESIEALDLQEQYLINARKWLILGCYTAQRGNDLLTHIVKKNFFKDKKDEYVIRFTQQKTGEDMEIRALPKVEKMYLENDLPTKISLQKLNDYVKILCEKAGIDTPIKAGKKEKIELKNGKTVIRKIVKTRPKFKYIASHDFRRTFCTMHFRKLKNEEIMMFSGHRTTGEFLKYIGEKDNDFSGWDKLYEDEKG